MVRGPSALSNPPCSRFGLGSRSVTPYQPRVPRRLDSYLGLRVSSVDGSRLSADARLMRRPARLWQIQGLGWQIRRSQKHSRRSQRQPSPSSWMTSASHRAVPLLIFSRLGRRGFLRSSRITSSTVFQTGAFTTLRRAWPRTLRCCYHFMSCQPDQPTACGEMKSLLGRNSHV